MAIPEVALEIAQGATLQVPFTVSVSGVPAALSGARFVSTLKSSPNLPDTDPTVVTVDWTSTGNQPTGQETWVVPAELTINMTPGNWVGLVRSVGIPGLAEVTDLFEPLLAVKKSISSRS